MRQVQVQTRAAAKAASRLGPLLGLACLFFLLPSLAVSDTFVDGLAEPTGLAIHPNARSLYIKRGGSGTVWKVPIGPDGAANGSPVVVTNNFPLFDDIDFDAAGNLYAAVPNDDALARLTPKGIIEYANLRYWATGALAIEPPGLPTNKIYFGAAYYSSRPEFYSLPIVSFFQSNVDQFIGRPCAHFRFLHHRWSLNELVGTDTETNHHKLVSVNPTTGACTELFPDLLQPAGIAEDLDGNLYVADTLAETVTKLTPLGQVEVIATGLASPTGLVFDQVTGLLFIAETEADRITTVRVSLPGVPTADLSIIYQAGTPSPLLVGQKLTYKIIVKNNGPNLAPGVKLQNTLSPKVQFDSSPTCPPPSGRTITCPLGSLANGAQVTVNIVVKPQAAGTIVNTVKIEGEVFDPNGKNSADTEWTTARWP